MNARPGQYSCQARDPQGLTFLKALVERFQRGTRVFTACSAAAIFSAGTRRRLEVIKGSDL